MTRLTSLQTLASAIVLAVSGINSTYGHGAYHDVVERIERQLEKTPDDAGLHYELAEAHAGHDEPSDCLTELAEVERLAPDVYPTGYLRGYALFVQGENEQAKDALDEFLGSHPTHVEALITRGRVFAKMGRLGEASADFQAAVKSSPSPSSELVTELAHAYQKLGKPQEASLLLDASLKTSGDAPLLLECALKIETAAKLWDAALGRIDGLQEAAPRPEPWMAKRAELLTQAGRTEDARAAWTKLRDRLISLPSLERGTPQNVQLLQQSRQALGETAPSPVIAPPASRKP